MTLIEQLQQKAQELSDKYHIAYNAALLCLCDGASIGLSYQKNNVDNVVSLAQDATKIATGMVNAIGKIADGLKDRG